MLATFTIWAFVAVGMASPMTLFKVLANVAVADRTENGVGECMQPDVGIGMALQTMRVGNLHAAQPDILADGEAVHVEAGAIARLQQRCCRGEQPLGEFNIGGRRQLHVAG